MCFEDILQVMFKFDFFISLCNDINVCNELSVFISYLNFIQSNLKSSIADPLCFLKNFLIYLMLSVLIKYLKCEKT